MGERLPYTQEVDGSIPSSPTIFLRYFKSQRVKTRTLMTREQVIKIVHHGKSLRNSNLRNIDLSNLNLQDVDFTDAKIDHVNFKNSNLRHARFCESNVQYSNFSGADLTRSDFWKANIYSSTFIKATLNNAILSNIIGDFTNFEDAKLEQCDLKNSDLRHSTFERSILEYSNLQRANLNSSNLRYANLNNCNLKWADLFAADLRYSSLREVDLEDVNFEGCLLDGAYIEFYKFPSKTILNMPLGKLPDELTIELMIRQAYSCPDPEIFKMWAFGEDCPFRIKYKFERTWKFVEDKVLLKKYLESGGEFKPKMKDFELIRKICEYKDWKLPI